MYCENCKNISFESDMEVETCPVCGSTLKPIIKQSANTDMNIELAFSFYECSCGNMFHFSENRCGKCGQTKESQEGDIDPNVKKRIDKFINILEFIKEKDIYIKELRRDINKNICPQIYEENFIDFIQNSINRMNSLLEKKTFKNLVFNDKTIDSLEMQDKIDEIKKLFMEAYSIYEEVIRTEVTYIWENSYFRYLKTIEAYIQCIKTIIHSIVSKNLTEAQMNMKIAQQKLDKASEDIEIFSNIINIKSLEINNDIISKGKVDYALLFTMMLSGKEDFSDINADFEKMQLGIFNYFKDFLTNPFINYCSFEIPLLFKIAPYKLMGMAAYNENKFFEKIKVVLNLFEKAKNNDMSKLMECFNTFKNKYIYASKKLNELSQEFAMLFSYNTSETILIKSYLRWYKDLSEGIYKDISSILICCTKIARKDNLDMDFVMEWMGFPDKFDYLLKQNKLKLHKLTEGVNKIIRNSEAHVDYDILDKERKIIIRNKKFDSKTVDTITLSFEEFLLEETTLSETIFSIFAAIDIFIINNYSDMGNFMLEVNTELQDITDTNCIQFLFSVIGIINLDFSEVFENEKKLLIVKGTTIGRKDKEIFQKCISVLSYDIINKPYIDLVYIELADSDENIIGSVKIITEYIKRYNITSKQFQKYELLLLIMTSKLEYYLENETVEKSDLFGFSFIGGILKFGLELINKVNESIKLYTNDKQLYVLNLKNILDEFNYIKSSINEYMTFVDDDRLLKYTQKAINGFIHSVRMIIPSPQNKNIPDFIIAGSSIQMGCHDICNIVNTEGNAEKVEKLVSKDKLLDSYETIHNKIVGRNDPCPCGSGKKYKKCCGKNSN